MDFIITAKKKNAVRIETKSGASATAIINGKTAHLIFMQVPGELREEGLGRDLLSAAEQQLSSMGVKELCCSYPDNLKEFDALLNTAAYKDAKSYDMLSINTKELLGSPAVIRSMKMNFKGIQTSLFEEMLSFQWEEVVSFLSRLNYQIPTEEFDHYDPSFSCVAYDELYRPKAVLLASTVDDNIIVELLMGFSKAHPQFVLCACQAFAKAITDLDLSDTYKKIYVLSATEYVFPLVRRLLDNKYKIQNEFSVITRKKELFKGGTALPEDLKGNTRLSRWRREADDIFAQRNICDKAIWQSIMNDKEI